MDGKVANFPASRSMAPGAPRVESLETAEGAGGVPSPMRALADQLQSVVPVGVANFQALTITSHEF